MKAIILAGGFGTRLKSVVADLPKPMAPVHGRPFLELLVGRLARFGITEIVLSVGYKQEAIRGHFGDGSSLGVSLAYAAEETPLGTGGALRAAMRGYPAERYLVLNGDSFFENDIQELSACHGARGAAITLALAQVPDQSRYGSVQLGPDGAISRFAEKGAGGPGVINAGVYLLERRVLELFPGEVCSFENDVLRHAVGNGLYGLRQPGYFLDIGIPEDYRAFCSGYHHLAGAGEARPEVASPV